MKKYKLAVYVGYNIGDIMTLDCVQSCTKSKEEICIEFVYKYLYSDTIVYTLFDGREANVGDWLVQDACDNWHVMTDEYYQKHKDDIIE